MKKADIGRRSVVAGGSAVAIGSMLLPRAAHAAKPVVAVFDAEAVILDPHATTAGITRTWAMHVFDTLFGTTAAGEVRPQMVESWESSADKLTWTFTLRPGLKWHDGAPVTAADCVASINRWGPRDSLGRTLMAVLASNTAVDQRSFRLVLKEPYPMLLQLLGKTVAPWPAMLPARVVEEAGDGRIKTIIGSGPFRFVAERWRPGNSMILARFADYVPRREPPDFTAGGKVVKIDELDMRVMPDENTAALALMAGELDYVQFLPYDMIDRLKRARGVEVFGVGGIHMFQGHFRLNHGAPPFDNPKVRQVLWHLVDQGEVMDAIGIAAEYRQSCPSFFMCDALYSTNLGAVGGGKNIAEARRLLRESGYNNEPVITLDVAGSISETASRVFVQSMKEAGFNVQPQSMDWGTVLARRARKEGWSMFPVYAAGGDMMSPLTHYYIATICDPSYHASVCDTRVPPLLAQFSRAPDVAAQKRIADELHQVVYQLTPSILWGQFTRPAGYRNTLKNLIRSAYPMFWEVEKV